MTVLSHLQEAYQHLTTAQEEAETGTSLMIRPIRENLQQLIAQTENIQQDDDTET